MSNTTRTLVVVSGGLSEESSTHRLADALTKAVLRAGGKAGVEFTVHRIDVRDHAKEIAAASVTGFAADRLQQAYDTLGTADAVVAVTPTYKASYTGLFKAFWDVTDDGVMSGVPVVLGATGGTPRHSLVTDTALRTLFAYMKACIAPTGIFVAAEDWGHASLDARVDEAAGELVRAVVGLGGGVPPVRGVDNTADPDGFEPPVEAEEADAAHARTLEGTRARARDPFVDVPTMSEMLGG